MKKLHFSRNDAFMLLVVTIWSLNLVLVKIALREIPPLPFNAIRLVLASLVLAFWLWRKEKSFHIEPRFRKKILLLSVTGYTIYQYLFITGLQHTTAANCAVLFGASPLVISLLSSFFKHERIKPLGWLGIAMGFTGIYLVLVGKSGGFRLSPATIQGDLLLFVVVLLWAHYTVSARPILKVHSPLRFAAMTMVIGTALFIPVSLPALLRFDAASVSPLTWVCLIYSGVVALAVAMIIWFNSVQRVGNSQTAVFANLQPAMAVCFAFLLLGESIPFSLIVGTVVIFLGIFLTRRGREARS